MIALQNTVNNFLQIEGGEAQIHPNQRIKKRKLTLNLWGEWNRRETTAGQYQVDSLAADELAHAKEKTKNKLSEMCDHLRSKVELSGDKAREAADETRNAFSEIRSNLRTLFE